MILKYKENFYSTTNELVIEQYMKRGAVEVVPKKAKKSSKPKVAKTKVTK